MIACGLAGTAAEAQDGRGISPVLTESFTTPLTPGLTFPGRADDRCGAAAPEGTNAACIDDALSLDGGAGTGRLLLTEAYPHQLGYVWLERAFDLGAEAVTVEFDFYIYGGTSPPADGLSVIFSTGNPGMEPGRGGGAIGTGGMPGDNLSVSFDIWDNGDADPEGPCDGASSRTCHVEVNRGGDPELDPPLAFSSDVPNFAAAGNEGTAIHATIVLNDRELLVVLSTDFAGYGRREVLHLPLDAAWPPGGPARLALAAATGNGTANHAIDDLQVSIEAASTPDVRFEPPVTQGGINCGGASIPASANGLGLEIAADGVFGEVSQVIPGPPVVFVRRNHGRIPTGDDSTSSFDGPIAGVEGTGLEPLYQNEAASRKRIRYVYGVDPGRYEVALHFVENCPCGIDRQDRATRRIDAWLCGEQCLHYFSPALSAGKGAGACGPLLSTAVARRFEADASADEQGNSYVDVTIGDLGGGQSPGDASLAGITFRRVGAATGDGVSGDVEDDTPPAPPAYGAATEVIAVDFDGAADGTPARQVLQGVASVNFAGPGPIFLQYDPVITGGRLRLTDDGRFASAASVVFGGSVFDPLAVSLEAQFDVFISSPDGRPAADGLVFGLVAGSDPNQLGGAGGSLGFGGMGEPAIGVELDLWEGGGFGDDSGFNTDGQGHMAVIGTGASPPTADHVQDQNDFDPGLDAATGGWVDLLSPAGFHVEVHYTPEARVEVFLSSLGEGFPRRQVLGTFVAPFVSHEAMVGLFAATGGETATMEVDNLHVSISPCQDEPEVAAISGERERVVPLGADGQAMIEADGDASSAGEVTESLSFAWEVSGPADGAVVARPCERRTTVTFHSAGTYEVSLSVDDGRCGLTGAARDAVKVTVVPAGGAVFLRSDSNCDGGIDISDGINTLNYLFSGTGVICCQDAADTNDDGAIDITDAIVDLNYLFLGGTPPPAPFDACGNDPTEDEIGCETSGSCP